ncbi:MAG: hypothetical protein M5U05_19655 [Anaerolineales bacterium]|nr:hypothetical protein [Anaerolineales bacterium]
MSAGILALSLTACGDIVEVAQTRANAEAAQAEATHAQAEAERLAAETTRAQAETQARTAQALIDAQNARIEDYRLLLTLAFILAAGSMGLSLAVALTLRNAGRQPPAQIRYQLMLPTPPADPPAQIGTPAFVQFVQEREQRRALQARNGGRIL